MTDTPSLFIAGCLKCGTTALATYLSRHPSIFFPPKTFRKWGKLEPNYFASINSQLTEDDYIQYFSGMEPEQIGVDASPWYLYFASESSYQIHKYNPDAKVIVMLRRPMEVVESLYAELVFQAVDTNASLDEALARGIASGPSSKMRTPPIFYQDIVDWAPQVQHFMDSFPREQLKIVLFDDFVADTPKIYQEMLSFIGIDPLYQAEFPAVNSRKRVLSVRLNRALRNPPTIIRKLTMLPGLHSIAKAARAKILSLITSTGGAPPSAISDDARKLFLETLQPRLDHLETVLGRALPPRWYT